MGAGLPTTPVLPWLLGSCPPLEGACTLWIWELPSLSTLSLPLESPILKLGITVSDTSTTGLSSTCPIITWQKVCTSTYPPPRLNANPVFSGNRRERQFLRYEKGSGQNRFSTVYIST